MQQSYTTKISNLSPSTAQEPWPYNMLRHRLFWIALYFWFTLVGNTAAFATWWGFDYDDARHLPLFIWWPLALILPIVSLLPLRIKKISISKRCILTIIACIGSLFIIGHYFGLIGIYAGFITAPELLIGAFVWPFGMSIDDINRGGLALVAYFLVAPLLLLFAGYIIVRPKRISRSRLKQLFITALIIGFAITLGGCTHMGEPRGW